jgi:hypothetical protein
MDSKIETLREEFGIKSPDDWQHVDPNSILAIDGIGPQTLNHLRLHLASRGLTLLDDQTPDYWNSHLSVVRGTVQVSDRDNSILSPFVVLIDTGEQHPFRFQGITADANQRNRAIIVRTERRHLGVSRGDYSAIGLEGRCHIERKSMEDCIGTVLAFGERREQFERTLDFLAGIHSSAVIVESSMPETLAAIQSTDKKTAQQRRKIFHRQVMAWHDDYRIPWVFAGDRWLAEITTYRWLERQWRHLRAQQKQAEQRAAKAREEFQELGL